MYILILSSAVFLVFLPGASSIRTIEKWVKSVDPIYALKATSQRNIAELRFAAVEYITFSPEQDFQ